jgi:DNA-binding MarR family transcriptional regulator
MMSERQHVVKNDPAPGWSPAGAAFTAFLMRVFPLNDRLSAAGEAIAAAGGQTLARWLVLEQIQDQPATVADIARAIGHARQGVQRLADVLVGSGAASYEDNPRHRRASLLRITTGGIASLRTIQHAQRAWADRIGTELGQADLEQASRVLDRALQAASRSLPGLHRESTS